MFYWREELKSNKAQKMSEMHDQQTSDLMNSAHAADCQNVNTKDPLQCFLLVARKRRGNSSRFELDPRPILSESRLSGLL